MNLFAQPTIEYCEKPVSGLIKRPYYAISNFAFFASGVLILVKGRKSKLAMLFGYTAIVIGLLSFAYDASYLYISQLLDLTGMLLLVNILLYLNLGKIFRFAKRLVSLQIVLYLLSMATIMYFRGFAGNIVFGIYVLAVIVTEYILKRRKQNQNYKYWILAFAFFVLGFAIWLLDSSKTVCFSFGLLNGRAVFHYLNAISIYYLYIFYEANNSSA